MPRPIVRFRTAAFIRQGGRCFYCDFPMWCSNQKHYSSLYQISLVEAAHFRCTAEHLQPRRDGGKCSSSNIVAACVRCNLRRHARRKALTPDTYKHLVHSRLRKGRWHAHGLPPNSRLVTDACTAALRASYSAAQPER